jgi:hypothetical protein
MVWQPPLTPAFSGKPVVSTGANGKQFVLTWNYGTLLQATNLHGPWVPTAGATSPYTNTLGNPALFFKLRNP